jgi:hypothetical protein
MRILAIGLAALLALPVAALAADPVPGIYTSTANDFLEGRGSASWENAPLNKSINHVFNSQSWDGMSLGTEWVFKCGVGNTTVTNVDTTNGDGFIYYQTVYTGGTFWLTKNGPWGDSVNDLTGTLNTTTDNTTVAYSDGNPIWAVSNVNTTGLFDGSDCVLEFAIANALGLGDTDVAGFPMSYPPFLDPMCTSGSRIRGSWGDLLTLAMSIDCPTPIQSHTWGSIKTLHDD